MLVFLDCRVVERKGATPSKTKLFVNEEELLSNAVKKAVGKYINGTATEDIDNVFNRIKSVTCNGSDLTEFTIDDPDYKLRAMNSTDTPIFEMGIDILLTPVEQISTTNKTKKIIDARALLMKEVQLDLRYLKMKEEDIDKEPEVDEHILANVYGLFEEIEVGYCSNDQKKKLLTNAENLKNTLCFVQKHWKVLLRTDYPHIPTDDFKSSKLLNLLTDLNRKKKNE